jgi:hypothetical protein
VRTAAPAAIYVTAPPEDSADTPVPSTLSAARSAESALRRARLISIPPDAGSREVWVARALLVALGKDLALASAAMSNERGWALAAIWLRAHRVGTLFAIGIEHASAGSWRRLIDLVDKAGLDVWMLSETGRLSRGQRELMTASPIETCAAAAFTRWATSKQPDLRQRAAEEQARLVAARFPAVPTVELPYFRDHCGRLLSSTEFEIVDHAYVSAFTRTAHWLGARDREELLEDHVGAFLADLVRDARGIHEQLTRLRGAQAAFWRKRWLLKIRPDALASAYALDHSRADGVADVALLNGYVSPRTAAIAAIALRTRLPPRRLAQLNADQVSSDCRQIDLGDTVAALTNARPLVSAHRLDGQDRGHDASGALFCTTDGHRMRHQSIQALLRRTAVETGIPLTQAWSAPVDREHPFWMHRRGVSLQPLPASVL